VILLDTHIWRWWVGGDARLPAWTRDALRDNVSSGLGVSVISCWEVAKLVEIGKVALDRPVDRWITAALARPGVRLLDLTVPIAVESTRLPPPFHRDPADQLLVATARVLGLPLLTVDARIVAYPHVETPTASIS
jgi:PIN domain nuclease of toxin-antitoxin system